MSIECGLSTVLDLFKEAFPAIKRRVKYVMSSKSFVVALQVEVRKLENEAERLNALVDQARNNVRNLHVVFAEWKASADKALEEARNLLDAFEKESKKCCYGTLPDPYCRHQFSMKAEATIKVIQDLAGNCARFRGLDDISIINPAPENFAAPTLAIQSTTATAAAFFASTSIKLREAGVFESRATIIGSIMDALADNSNSVIGVYGMGGVGKSTLLNEVERILSEEKSFDWVAKADVSENPDIKRIQGEIADALGLTDIKDKETISGRAKLLHKRLTAEIDGKKKVIIILDNLWMGLNLKLVGIPCGEHDNKIIGCKLLLTSRDRNVLQSEMGCDKAFPLGGLKEDEAKILFERIVGDKVHDDEFRHWVEVALNKCAGVPFLIVAMAKRLKNAELYMWKDTLKKIKKSEDNKINDSINQMLQWSYENLEDDEKSILRLCAVYGSSKPSLENLMRYGIGLGLFQEAGSMEDARDRLSSHISALQASSLLLDSEDVASFKIHDLVVEFVALVSSKDQPLLVWRDKVQSLLKLQKDKPNSYKAICFPYVDMKELPQELDCPELHMFLLFTNNESLCVPDSLFNSMKKLMVLNLTGIRFTCSLSLFKFLKNLHTLCLDDCSLYNVAVLGGLKRLQILSFVNSDILRLPKEIRLLTELRLLDLNNCSQLKVIEPGVLGSLTKLEELYMEDSFDEWNALDPTSATNASLIELNNMENLCTLHVSIPDPKVLPENLNVEKLTKYKIRIGNLCRWPDKCKGSRSLELKLDPLSGVLHKGCIQNILYKTDYLFLGQLDGSAQSMCFLSQKGFPELKHLRVEYSPSNRYILQSPSPTNFKMLESLLLKNLTNLEKICNNHISSKSFNTLKIIRVESCDKMEVLFPLSVVRGLPQLKEIKVVNCKLMHGIVEADDCSKVEFHSLRILKLCDLPNIRNFVSAKSTPSSSTSDGQISPQFAFFNGQQVSFSSLESLTMKGIPNLKEIWSDESPLKMSNLQSLKVVRCESLLKVISLRSLAKLHKLQTLTIQNCISVQEIFYLDRPSGSGTIETVSQLTKLEISNMRSLRCIWNKNPRGIVSFHNLERLEVRSCDNLGFIFFPSMIKSLAQMRDLTVSWCKKMEVIITEEEGLRLEISETLAFLMLTNISLRSLDNLTCFSRKKGSEGAQNQDRVQSCSTVLFDGEVAFSRLETLQIDGLGKLGFIFLSSMAKSLGQLKKLNVRFCAKMEAVIMEEEQLGMGTSKTLAFPMLTKLELCHLESLTRFSHGKSAREARSEDCIKSCSTTLFNREVAFLRLETLEFSCLDKLGFIFLSSTAKSFGKLKILDVQSCDKMEAIIMEEEPLGMGTSKTLAFPMLTKLTLYHLESLTCFSHGKSSQEASSEDRIKSCSTTLFNREVAFPNLESLYIERMDKIEKLWENQVAADSFHNLKSLSAIGCDKLVNLVPSCVLRQLLGLESLKAQSCGSLEVVFELQPLNAPDRHDIVFFPLQRLQLVALPKLKCIWDRELHRQVKFQSLRSISIYECESLTSLFPASAADDLVQLEELKIKECGIVELINKEEGPVPRIVFPKLTSLELKNLRELNCICIGTHVSHWPVLKTLEVQGCNKVGIFASRLDNEITLDKQPLFFVEKGTFPNVEELKLDLFEGMEIWNGHFHEEKFFHKLRVLKLRYLSKESPISTYSFVESLTTLEELVVSESYIEEPSNNEEAIEDASHKLKVIPFSGHIRHLQTLDMSQCDGLSNMFTPTTAENLVALTKLKIRNCRKLSKVISDEEGEEERCLVTFKQLKYMELDGLVELRCFSSGIYTLMFPLLEDAIVNRCPNMKFFFKGPIEAPKLERVQVVLKELYGPRKCHYFWKEDLNVTIQNMFEEMATVAGLQIMRLFDFPELVEKWHSKLNPIKSSWQLQSLTVDNFSTFINAIPFKLMLVLKKMKSLEVHNCESLEEIFDLDGLEAMESIGLLPQLRYLSVANLPKLRQLWNEDLQGMMHFNLLRSLTLYKCSNLRHAFVPSMAPCLANLREMEIRDCDQMEGVIGEEEAQGNVAQTIIFPSLWQIQLERLPNLTSFLSAKNNTLNCPRLRELTIAHCPKMRSLTGQSWMEIDHDTSSLFTPQVQFPRLGWMFLDQMDSLSKIWTNDSQEALTFDYLRKVKVQNCKSLENLFPHWVATSVNELQELRVESCEIEEIVTLGDHTPHFNNARALFPNITSLVLHDMPRLKRFCPDLPTLNWPLLEELRVTHCSKVNMFSFAASKNNWTQGNDQQDISDQEAHSSFERGFFTLKKITLFDKDIQMIQDGKLHHDIFGKREALTLACFHDEKTVFPSRFFLERFSDLQSLEILCSSFEDIFPNEGFVDEGRSSVLENLKELKLSKLSKLKRVWREDYLLSKILQSIQILKVKDCPGLTTLFPTVASFQNLTKLVVKNSSGLVYLATISMVINLVHLTSLSIIGCERLKEVVGDDENRKEKVISLEKLRSLTLQNLSSLECFSSIISCSFKFPSLWRIIVEECPKMKIFSKGTVSTPHLFEVRLLGCIRDNNWERDLNTTIQQFSA